MILTLDTEFNSIDEPSPDLISIGLVREDNEFFYAELPSSEWLAGASLFVRQTVVPLLWLGSWCMPRQEISRRLVEWIAAIDDKVMIVTDAPEFDFELIKPLLNPWPRNLAISCMRFDSFAMGRNRQPWLVDIKAQFHAEHGSEHHALRDAQGLREMMMKALEAGWWPNKSL